MKKYCLAFIFLLGVISVKAQLFTNYTTAEGLPDNFVNEIAVDKNNVKWFATQGGVAKLDGTAWATYTTANGLSDNYINCIAVDKAGIVWAGTDLGINKFDGSNWTYFQTGDGLVDDVVKCVAVDLDSSVWIGTTNGISHFDGTTWTNYTTTEGLPDNLISCITIDESGNKWIGTYVAGLAKYDNSTFTTFTTANSLLSDNIISVAIDKTGKKWIGTFSGISVLDASDVWQKDLTASSGLYNNYVRDITIDTNGVMWAGMYIDYLNDGGVTKYDGSLYTSYTMTQGLVGKDIKSLTCDNNNNIWIATGSGVSVYTNTNIGIDENQQNSKLTIYPNPSNDYILIKSDLDNASFNIINAYGQTVKTGSLSSSVNTIDINDLRAGQYFIQLYNNTHSYNSQIIIN